MLHRTRIAAIVCDAACVQPLAVWTSHLMHSHATLPKCQAAHAAGKNGKAQIFELQQPPFSLLIRCPQSVTDIKVITGGLDHMQIEQDGFDDKQQELQITHHASAVTLTAQQTAEADVKPQTIVAHVPERYCDVDIETKGGQVSVQSITEAKLRISSGSGSVHAGKIKATTAFVNTNGGDLVCDVVTADKADFITNGGSISMKRLVGKQCVLDTRQKRVPGQAAPHQSNSPTENRGHVSVDTAYTESLKVITRGSMISFGLLDSMEGYAHLQSAGGKLTVEGLDGSALLESQGGAIQVNLQENVRGVQALSQGGNITCTLSPSSGATLAKIDPINQATFGEGISYQENGEDGMLHVSTSESAYARQDSNVDRQTTERQQQISAQTHSAAADAVVELQLLSNTATASCGSQGGRQAGNIHVAVESWISRAMAKAKTRARS